MADDIQVQQFADTRVRPHSERVRDLVILLDDDRASIDDIYQYLNGAGSGWVDARTDGPPNLLTASDILAFNSFAEDLRTYIKAHAQYSVILGACVRTPI